MAWLRNPAPSTADKRSQVVAFRLHVFANATGAQHITGLGFKPKGLAVLGSGYNSGTGISKSTGAAEDSSPIAQYGNLVNVAAGSIVDNAAFISATQSVGTVAFRAVVTSFNDDGISVNVTLASATEQIRTYAILFYA